MRNRIPGAAAALVSVLLGAVLAASGPAAALADEAAKSPPASVPLRSTFDETCIAAPGRAGNCDTLGLAFPSAQLAQAGFTPGRTAAVPGTDLEFPIAEVAAGEADSATGRGQTVTVDRARGATMISVIGTATEKNLTRTGRINFIDGTSKPFRFDFGDWTAAAADPVFGNIVVAATPSRRFGADRSVTGKAAIYATAPVRIPTGKGVASLTFPDEPGTAKPDGRIHVFAIATDGRAGAAVAPPAPATSLPILLIVLLSVAAIVGAGLLALGIVWWVRRRRRRRTGATRFADSAARPDSSASWLVFRALSALVAACGSAGIRVPRINAVFVEGPRIRVRLSGPAERSPAPWISSSDGQSWSMLLSEVHVAPVADLPPGMFERLVTLGVSDSGRVLLNLDLARSPISIDGPVDARVSVMRSWLAELTGNPWSQPTRIVVIGAGLPESSQTEQVASLDTLAPELEVDGSGILILAKPPTTEQLALLAGRFASPGFAWVVVVLGPLRSARWSFTAAADGWLRSGFLPDVAIADRPPSR